MLETVFNVLKVSVVLAIAYVFVASITTLLNLISSLVFGNIIGEVIALISMYLPFNAMAVFASFGAVITAILAFMVAKKIFDLTSWSVSSI